MTARQTGQTKACHTVSARRAKALLAALGLAACATPSANAGAPPCVAAGQVPASLSVTQADLAAVPSGLTMLGWNGSQQLQVQELRIVTGDCQASVTAFAAAQIFFKGNLVSTIGEAGALQAARAAPRQPSLPPMNEGQHDEEDHTHSDSGLGEFITGTRVAVKTTPQGVTEYFVGAWKKQTAITVAIFARNPQGIVSPAAPLMRSQFPVRGITYIAGADATSGTLGITQEAAGELHLLSVRWTHQDFTR